MQKVDRWKVKLTSSDPKSNPQYARMNPNKAWCTKGTQQYLEVSSELLVQVLVHSVLEY